MKVYIDQEKLKQTFQKAKKEIEEFHFKVGIFEEETRRYKVTHQKSKRKAIRPISSGRIRNSFLNPLQMMTKVSNAGLLNHEKENKRDYLGDCFSSKNPNMLLILTQLKAIRGSSSPMNMQIICQSLVRTFRSFVESNPYNLRNAPSTIQNKGFDAWLRDSRQLQMSCRAKFLRKETVITESK